MDKKRMSGHCRSIVLAVLFLMLFCSAVASAATASAATTASCPSGCGCLRPADAKEKGYDPCGGQLSACGYDIYQKTMYCYKTSLSLTLRTLPPISLATTTTVQPGTCPSGCSCMFESDAKEKLGSYSRCSETPCYSVVTGSATLKAYCFRKGTPPTTTTPVPSCPQGCSCISKETADARGGTWARCSEMVCGYEQSTATLTAVVNMPKYCMKQESTAPVCPQGCVCLSDEKAKARYGEYTRCSSDICGKEIIQPAGAAAYSVPQYCVKQATTTPACPQGCICTTNATAVEKKLTFCGGKLTSCGYNENKQPLYCFKPIVTVTPTPQLCPQGCYCIQEAEAKLKFGPNNYARCSEKICGNDQSATNANGIPLYCFKPLVTPTPTPAVCPEGCYCLKPDEAKEKFGDGNYARCKAEPCSSDQSRYCFKPGVTVQPTQGPCPQGCTCMGDAAAKENGLTLCRGVRTNCGIVEPTGLTFSCFEQVPSPTCVYDYQKNACTGSCLQGYTCGLLASKKDATGKVEYAVCGCTGQPKTECTFDKEKQVCTGSCQNGAACAIVGKKVDDKTGEVSFVCGCPPPSTEPCSYDKEKQTCIGTCQSGAACAILGKKTDDAGNVYVFCGCPQPSSCVYDYSKDACVGTCTKSGDICQLNTVYRDQTTGKVTYAECHCKGGGEVPETCTCDPASGHCTGTCSDGKACMMTATATDNAGKNYCTTCECKDTCVLTANNECSGTCLTGEPCARMVTRDDSGREKVSCICGGTQPGTPAGVAPSPQGFFDGISKGIFSFFNKLFGGK